MYNKIQSKTPKIKYYIFKYIQNGYNIKQHL